jgi:tetratricopeptide (TPR) repeat protein
MAMETARPYDLSYAHAAQGLAHLTVGNLENAIRHLEEALHIARDYQIMLLVPHAARYLGRAYALIGRLAEAETLLVGAVEQTRSQSLSALRGWCSTILGFTRALGGAHGEAELLLGNALDFAHRQGYRPLEVHALRLLGVIDAMAGRHAASEQSGDYYFRNAITLADQIGMGPELAHCHHGYGDLLADKGCPAEARTELAIALDLYGSMGMVRDVGSVNASILALEGPSRADAPVAETVAARRTV